MIKEAEKTIELAPPPEADAVADAVLTTGKMLQDYAAQAESSLNSAIEVTQQYDMAGADQARAAYAAAQASISQAVQREMETLQNMSANMMQVYGVETNGPVSERAKGGALGPVANPSLATATNENPEQAIVAAVQGMTPAMAS